MRRLQCDEIWEFVGAKAKNVNPEKKAAGWGDIWTWTGIDADSKLCVSYLVGGRDTGWATEFMEDCAKRISGRVQITTDGHKVYLEAVENAFGADIDYAQLQKIYGAPSDEEQRRYSPARCIGCEMKTVSGDPDPMGARRGPDSVGWADSHQRRLGCGARGARSSGQRRCTPAIATNASCVVLSQPGIGLDIDTPDDLEQLAISPGEKRSQVLARKLGFGASALSAPHFRIGDLAVAKT